MSISAAILPTSATASGIDPLPFEDLGFNFFTFSLFLLSGWV